MRLTPDGQLVMVLQERPGGKTVTRLGDGRVFTCDTRDLQDAPDVGPFRSAYITLQEAINELGRLMMFERQAD